MFRYIVSRLLLSITTLFGVATLVFFMLNVLPGDAVQAMLLAEGGSPTPELIASERARLGLDRPVLVQYGDFITHLAVFDLGKSSWTQKPALEEIATRLPVTMQVAVLAMLFATAIAIPLGTIAGIFRETWVDHVIRAFAIGGVALPSFWFGMLIALVMLWSFNWLPALGSPSLFNDPIGLLKQLALPS